MPPRKTTEADYQRRILRAERWLEEHLDEPLDPAALAQAASFSLHHFHRIFRALTGESVMQHVRRLRLERAAQKLRRGEEGILALSLEAGFESHEAFTRAFGARFGVPPSFFRDRPALPWPPRERAPEAPAGEVWVAACPAVRVAIMRHRGSYAGIGPLWQRMLAWGEERGALGDGAALYGVCHDDPDVTAAAFLRFDAGIAVGTDFDPRGEVAMAEIPAGVYAVGLHRGSYQRLADTYLDVIGRWFPTSGYEPAAEPVIEHYRNDPACTAEDDLLTEVRVRVA